MIGLSASRCPPVPTRLLRCMSPDAAPNGPAAEVTACLLLWDERTWRGRRPRSELDPERTSVIWHCSLSASHRLAPENIEMLSVGLFSFKVASGEAIQA